MVSEAGKRAIKVFLPALAVAASFHAYGTCWTAPTQVPALTGLQYCFFYLLSDEVLTTSHCCWSLWSLAALVCFLNPPTALQVILPLKFLEPSMGFCFLPGH